MLSKIFLGLSLVGAEWVLYLLVALSVFSVAVIFERLRFFRHASAQAAEFRARVRQELTSGRFEQAHQAASIRRKTLGATPDLESEMVEALTSQAGASTPISSEAFSQIAQDSVIRGRLAWEKNLAFLATIGANAPFIGLFGTVLGIIKAFHDLSQQAGGAAQTVTSGISEALVATAIGLLVAIPAVIAYNLFQRKVRTALGEAEALKSFVVAKMAAPSQRGHS